MHVNAFVEDLILRGMRTCASRRTKASEMSMSIPVIEQAKIQAQVLVPLIKAMQAELGEARANALVRKALGEIYRRHGEEFWRAKREENWGTAWRQRSRSSPVAMPSTIAYASNRMTLTTSMLPAAATRMQLWCARKCRTRSRLPDLGIVAGRCHAGGLRHRDGPPSPVRRGNALCPDRRGSVVCLQAAGSRLRLRDSW